MLRIHFTADDLARVRIDPCWGPLPEVVFSLQQLAESRPSSLLDPWQGAMRARGEHLPPSITERLRPLGYVDLMTLTGPAASMDEAADQLRTVGRRQLRRELEYVDPDVVSSAGAWSWMRAVHQGDGESRQRLVKVLQRYYDQAVGPHWDQMHSHLAVDRSVRIRLMAEGGVEQLLRGLHHTIRWQPPVLEVTRPPDLPVSTLHLDGRGLVLVPSIFCSPYPQVFVGTVDEAASIVLFYPALREAEDAVTLWSTDGSRRPALEALLGRTRASMLQLTTEPCTTTELARSLGVAVSTASHHASVLRAAGLIDTRRHGGAVLHHVTWRGELLLHRRGRANR